LIINETVKITEYAPAVFERIRQHDGITSDAIRLSLGPKFNRDAAFKAGESQGKSGSFFFFCHDKRFIIKTMSNSELFTFFDMIQKYTHHLLGKDDSDHTARKESMYSN